MLGSWSRVIRSNLIQEVKVGYNNFQWANQGLPQVGDTFEYRFPGLTVGKPYNYPQWLYQDYGEARYDLTWNRGSHDVKFGAEFMAARVHALWYLQREGIMTFTSVPADISRRIPASAPYDISQWDLTGLDPIAQRFERNYNNGDWTLEVPGPTWAIWARRHLAGRQQLHRQPRRPLGRRLERRRHPRHDRELDPDRQRLGGGDHRHPGDGSRRLRLPQRHPRPRQHRAARRLHLEHRRQERLRGPRRHRPLLRAAADAVHLQPAAVQPDDHRVVQQRRAAQLRRGSDPRRRHLRPGAGQGAAAGGAHLRPRLQERLHLAEQHRLPEAARMR